MRSRPKPFTKKSLGQNFLTDSNYVNKIIDAVNPCERDVIIEIGPGRGALTERLVNSGSSVVAVELDRNLAAILARQFANDSNFRIVEANALEVNFQDLKVESNAKMKLVANLPYYISTAILQRLAEQRECFSELVLMFQKEVVDRITAKPGNSERGFLTVIVEAGFHVEKLFDVPSSAFFPRPKVSSAVVRLTPKPKSGLDETSFRTLASSSFAQKRKTIANNLRSKYPNCEIALTKAGIDPARRAETLTLQEWMRLAKFIDHG